MANPRRTARATGIVVGLTIAVLAAVGGLLAISHSNSAALEQRLVVSIFETISMMRQAQQVVDNTEIGERSYLVTGDVAELKSYEQARLRIDVVLRQLEASALEGFGAEQQIAEFRVAVERKLDEQRAAIQAYQLHGRDAATALGSAHPTSDRLLELAESYIENQRLVLGRRLGRLRSEQEKADVAGLLVLGGAFGCLIAGMYIIVRGAGRLEEAQAQLTARSRLLQATLETLHDPIFVLDGGRVVAWNESFAQQAGWDPLRHAPPTLERLLSSQSPTTRALLLPLGLDKPAASASATVRVVHDGHDYEVSRGEMPSGGAVIRSVDVTDKLRDEAALRQGQKMEAVGQLTGGMAHDFNNILQIVQANLDLMKIGLVADPSALARLQTASAATERGARLTQQLLAFARRQPLAPRPTNIARLVNDLAGLLRHALGERIALEVVVPQDAWNARIDPGQLENAILNLAINARDAMAEGGTVRLQVSNATLDRRYAALHPEAQPGAYVLIDVEDTGTGMPAEVVAQAFDPYFTTKQEGKGTGLGLSMVYGFVRQSNGHIRIDSAPGQGTSLKMYLPRTRDAVLDVPPLSRGRAAGHERILVVEDNPDVRRSVVELLKSLGYRVVETESPDAAAEILSKDRAFDLLFTDVVLPGTIKTVELAELAQRLNPSIAVLLTSGYARDFLPRHEGPAFPLITKPFRVEDLAAKVQSVIAAVHDRAPASPTVTKPAATTAASRPLASPWRVLLVEDEVLLRMSTADMLEKLNCFVTAVGSGEEAIKVLSNGGACDLLLTDLGLPGMSGEELAREVRRHRPHLPVVIASGYGQTGLIENVHFIGKPYSAIDLQQALEQSKRAVAHS